MLLTAFFFAWSIPVPRWLFATKMTLAVLSVVVGSLAYSLVWLIPIDHLRSWEFAVAVFAVVNLATFVWLCFATWAYGPFVGAVLMFAQFLNAALIVLGVSPRVTVAAIIAPGTLLVLVLAFWPSHLFRRGTTLGWRLVAWGPRTDDPMAQQFYERIVRSPERRPIERGYADMQLAWISLERGDRYDAIRQMDEAVSLLDGAGAASRRAEAYRAKGQWLGTAGEVEEGHAAACEAIAISRSLIGGHRELARALLVRAVANAQMGDLDASRRDANEAKHLTKRANDPALESLVRDLRVVLAYDDLDERGRSE